MESIILLVAKTVGVPGVLLLAICTNESGLNNLTILHDGGSPSVGICQVKKETAELMGYKGISYGKLRPTKNRMYPGAMEAVGRAKGLMNPKTNAEFAAKYLKYQLERYDNNWCKATAAFNAGTYNPSKKSPGKPRNYKYVKQVTLFLDDDHKDYLVCGARKVEE